MERLDRPFVSVIIPVFNDAEKLNLCLSALERQTYNPLRFEIIVVDNGSDHPHRLKQVAAQFDRTRLAYEPTPGSYAARNQGLLLAQGEVIAFTDADCLPAEDWLEQGVRRLMGPPESDMVAGHIATFPQDAHQPSSLEIFQMITAFPQEDNLHHQRGGATANLFTRKVLFDRVGPFNTRLKSYGDLEWGRRVYLAGYRQTYAPEVRVQHPARPTWTDISRKTIRVAGGLYDFFVNPEDPWWQRQKTFARLVIDDLFPSFKTMVKVWTSPHADGINQKLKVFGVMFSLRYLAAWEKTRLHFGGISKRA